VIGDTFIAFYKSDKYGIGLSFTPNLDGNTKCSSFALARDSVSLRENPIDTSEHQPDEKMIQTR
jgi:hypothetical protein